MKQVRKCVACRLCKPQNEMLRLSRIDNEFVFDTNQKLGGRGAYVCLENSCLNLTIKKRLFNKSFKTNINLEIYEKLGEYEKNS